MDQKTRAQITKSLRLAAAKLSASESGLQAPQVNNNGTSKKELMDQLIAVAHAGRAMQNALTNATPHGRDYQTLKPGAYQVARKQHDDRLKCLFSIMKDIEELAMVVQDQGKD